MGNGCFHAPFFCSNCSRVIFCFTFASSWIVHEWVVKVSHEKKTLILNWFNDIIGFCFQLNAYNHYPANEIIGFSVLSVRMQTCKPIKCVYVRNHFLRVQFLIICVSTLYFCTLLKNGVARLDPWELNNSITKFRDHLQFYMIVPFKI